MTAAIFSEVFDSIIDDYHAGIFGTIDERLLSETDPKRCQETLLECVLSSGWDYRKAKAAAQEFTSQFGVTAVCGVPCAAEIESFLRNRSIGHRFPRSRSVQIAESLTKLNKISANFGDFVGRFASEQDLRDHIVADFPGLGFKQTSMFLRDTGAARDLAVIDVHIIWFLRNEIGHQTSGVGKRHYLESEQVMSKLCQERELSMTVFDRLVWITVREFRKIRKSVTCGMQYALPLEA